jgi:membrane associated rhomboid family serine protease
MPRSFDEVPKLTTLVCVLCIAIFATIHTQGKPIDGDLLRHFGAPDGYEVWDGAWWGLITSALVHVEPWHLLFNLYWFWLLGGALERSVPAWKWIAFFLASAWISSGVQLALGDTGIGLSGVGYALFGLGWIAGDELPELKSILNDQVIKGFLIWGVGCVFLDALNILHVANGAHFGGCAFGAAVAALWIVKKQRALAAAGLLALFVVTGIALFWCPWGTQWNMLQGTRARVAGDYDSAIRYFQKGLAGEDTDRDWSWYYLAITYGQKGDRENYQAALVELRRLNAGRAEEVEREFGPSLDSKGTPH